MCHLVIIQITAGREPLPAHPALMRLLPTVNPPMRVETGRRGKTLITNVTHVRPLTRVNADVSLQQTGSVKGLAAIVARQHVLFPSPHPAFLRIVIIGERFNRECGGRFGFGRGGEGGFGWGGQGKRQLDVFVIIGRMGGAVAGDGLSTRVLRIGR